MCVVHHMTSPNTWSHTPKVTKSSLIKANESLDSLPQDCTAMTSLIKEVVTNPKHMPETSRI